MDAKSLVTLGAITGLVAGAVWLSATLDRKPDMTEPVAAAIKGEMAWFTEIYADPAAREADKLDTATICIASDEPLDFVLLAERLAGAFIRPVPVADCASKTVEGDFGMFIAMTYWFDESGVEAGMLEVKGAHCPTQRRCIVDIDRFGAGNSYEVRRSDEAGEGWWVTRNWMRWIV